MILGYALVLISVVMTSSGLLLFRAAARRRTDPGLGRLIAGLRGDPRAWAAVGCILPATLLYIAALGLMPLSNAYALTGLNFVLTVAGGSCFLKEHVTLAHAGGALLITAGVIVFNM